MNAPLPAPARQWLQDHAFEPARMHAGLRFTLFDRYQPGRWTLEEGKKEKKGRNPKQEWLQQFDSKRVGEAAELERRRRWLVELVERQGGRWGVFRNTWRFATGLGLPHPVENGFHWHPTLGVPYLPGAAVKGMARAWLTAGWDGAPQPDREQLARWFGRPFPGEEEPDRVPAERGRWVFFDALPVEPVMLRVDIMTPHQQEWYTRAQPAQPLDSRWVPGDWQDTQPLPFLVSEHAALLVAVAPRQPGAGGDEVEQVWAVLTRALEMPGAGAKTAVGYGRFEPDRDQETRLRRDWQEQEQARAAAARLAAIADPLERELEELVAAVQAREPGKEPWLIWWEALKQGRWQGCDRVRVARRLRDELMRLKKWPQQSPKKAKQNKDWTRAETIRQWLEEADCP
ncbi:putative CRISPR-associated RAMP protein, Cmr6 family [Candidatus Hydrogenisulfobacillus filiaventi]|uniref:Putative CRISPR-associated RAMP protein, Cmr6 family n=1 Tax=Candidatus Hydrogenisulfobacillus filiaventi TaxID=2707344 RepID=A0A6F8ZDY2_9FIRM|nr:putative CRISPR-associated RAMP protein, Cmr6 family [Candidatus Hydrogenisulfobacillus filiaventi]